MSAPEMPLAWDEAGRLDALRALKLLDTPPDERFDRITRMAQEIFQVGTALISLVDAERQWFKSRQGLDQPQTSRDVSFCSHAILQDDVFVVEDARTDPRFAENPLVTAEPFIRFYAGKPLFSPEGKKVGTLCLIDRSPRRLAASELDRLRNLAAWAEREIHAYATDTDALTRLEGKLRLAHALEHATEGIISADVNGLIETVNPAACEIFRMKAPDMIGRNISDLLPSRQQAQHADFMARLQSGCTVDARTCLEVTAVRRNGEEFPAEVSFRKLEVGHRIIFTGIVHDISERKNLERAKSEFVASVSHELRTPLTAILGALGMLKEDLEASSDAAQLAEIAYLNSLRLNAMVNDILDTEKLDADMMVFHKEDIEVSDLIDEACLLNQPFARGEGILLRAQPPATSARVRVDRSRFIQVMTNLISNACKFSPEGGSVLISAGLQGNFARIAVEDRGTGIPDEFRGRIFQRFAQANSARDHQKTGTGLGLSISKAMIEKMGGRIGYESVAGKGSTFFLLVPLAP